MSPEDLFAKIVRERGDYRASKTPTRTFRAVLAALVELEPASTTEIAYAAMRGQGSTHAVLHRLLSYGCAHLEHGALRPNGLHRDTIWTLTDLGRALARDLEQGT